MNRGGFCLRPWCTLPVTLKEDKVVKKTRNNELIWKSLFYEGSLGLLEHPKFQIPTHDLLVPRPWCSIPCFK